jgi:hypothetical protein
MEKRSLLYRRMKAVVYRNACHPMALPLPEHVAYQSLKLFVSMGLSTRLGAMYVMLSLLNHSWPHDYPPSFISNEDFGCDFDNFFADIFNSGLEYEWFREDQYLKAAQIEDFTRGLKTA